MKFFHLFLLISMACLVSANHALAQRTNIISGEIYTIQSKLNTKLLNVKNSSINNNADVDCRINTSSDAERWIATRIDKKIFTFTNVASGKLLHIASTSTDLINVNQHNNTHRDDVKWVVRKAGRGYFYLKPALDKNCSLHAGIGENNADANVDISYGAHTNADKWALIRQTGQDGAPTTAIADKIFEAWYNKYKVETGKGFWSKAEMMEILLDAYEVTGKKNYITKFNNMYKDFIKKNKTDWMYNNFNDDITWAVLFCVRGYLLTGNKIYLEQGKKQFDEMYARAYTKSFGGGLIWYETKKSKNACINGPAMVACCYLARATGDSTYYDKAITLYKWSKLYLFDTATGKVNDNVDFDKSGKIKISNWSSTYNQGTYLGAATMLYKFTKDTKYLSDAEKIARYTRSAMYHNGVINNEDGGDDLPGFKGIFARYARMYTLECKRPDLIAWIRLNAKVAYNNRNAENLIQTKWGTATSAIKPGSDFGCSSSVSLLFNSLFVQKIRLY
ncbi:glycoside hydrolase family 76 protein [Arachidicoccus soli]|uniref:Ricin B lectin domain-containing protein n=1 Tax=Arachidicoccus soli TaxID=2341117 RepID=A0A386HTE5_9BACT|nr:glycoside hydrolase family 76 protein [Arachidicoccus soli]AYD48939.1 hypothetical protein D6B99_15760 [Arachidicoccus soli]